MALPSTADFGAEVGGEPWLVTAPRRSIAAPIASASASCRRENGNARSFPCGSRIWNKQAPSRGHVIITWVPSGILPVVLRRSVQKVRISYSPDSVLTRKLNAPAAAVLLGGSSLRFVIGVPFRWIGYRRGRVVIGRRTAGLDHGVRRIG